MWKDGAEPKEGSWTSLQDYGDLDNPILTHATELTVEQTQVCSKLFNCFHGERVFGVMMVLPSYKLTFILRKALRTANFMISCKKVGRWQT